MFSEKSLAVLFAKYMLKNYPRVLLLLWEHLWISAVALLIILAVCVPLGVYMTRNERINGFVFGFANTCQTIPSLALLGILIFVFGVGNDNAIAALFLYGALPVLQNTYTGLKNVPPHLVEAARGMGMTNFQALTRVQIPIALPVIIAGVRVAAVWTIGTAALASAVGGGGLGKLIFSGLASIRYEVMLAGAVPVTLLALAVDYGLKSLTNHFTAEKRAKRKEKRMAKLEGGSLRVSV